jgi:hypothetical protein
MGMKIADVKSYVFEVVLDDRFRLFAALVRETRGVTR